MFGRLKLGWLALALVLVAGCLESKTILTVKKDGSGTIEQTAYFKEMDLKMEGMPKPAATNVLKKLKDGSADTAKAMGEGVTVQSVEELEPRGEWKGARVVYAFEDVARIKTGPAPPVSGIKASGDEQMRFEFTKGESPKLTVIMPALKPPGESGGPGAAGAKPGANQMPDATMMAMMAPMFEGMKIEFRLKVDGTITQTNALYVNKARNTVGLMQQNIGAMFQDAAALEKLKDLAQVKDPQTAKEKLQDPAVAKYLKFDPAEKVQIEFK